MEPGNRKWLFTNTFYSNTLFNKTTPIDANTASRQRWYTSKNIADSSSLLKNKAWNDKYRCNQIAKTLYILLKTCLKNDNI